MDELHNEVDQMLEKKERLEKEKSLKKQRVVDMKKTSARQEMLNQWGRLRRDFACEGMELTVNLDEPGGAAAQALTEYGKYELDALCEYVLPEDEPEKMEHCQKAELIVAFWRDHPGCLLYIFTTKVWTELRNLLHKPVYRSFQISDEAANATFYAVALGIADVYVSGYGNDRVAHLRFREDASDLLNALSNEEVRRISGEVSKGADKAARFLYGCGIVKMDDLAKQLIDPKGFMKDGYDARRFIFLHMCYLNWYHWYSTERGEYILDRSIEYERLMAQREMFGADRVEQARIPANRQYANIKEMAEGDRNWETLYSQLRLFYCDMDDGAVYSCLDQIWSQIIAGRGLLALWNTLEEIIELKRMDLRWQFWMDLMQVFLNTPVPALNGYTRKEYAKLTGMNVWELGIDDIEVMQALGLHTEVETNSYVAFLLTAQMQYRLFCELNTDDMGNSLLPEKPQNCSKKQGADWDWLCYLRKIRGGQEADGIRILHQYEWKDEGAAEELERLNAFSQKEAQWEDSIVPYCRERKKIGRNDSCPCGSGNKFKKCCMGKGIYD